MEYPIRIILAHSMCPPPKFQMAVYYNWPQASDDATLYYCDIIKDVGIFAVICAIMRVHNMFLNVFICNSITWCITEINGKFLKICCFSAECIICKVKKRCSTNVNTWISLR